MVNIFDLADDGVAPALDVGPEQLGLAQLVQQLGALGLHQPPLLEAVPGEAVQVLVDGHQPPRHTATRHTYVHTFLQYKYSKTDIQP